MSIAFAACGLTAGLLLHRIVHRCRGRSGVQSQLIQSTKCGDLLLRRLELADFDRGFLELLGQLTSVGSITRAQFRKRLDEFNVHPGYNVCVLEDVGRGRVVAAATLLVELKVIHACGAVGHIEDVVVDSAYRGQSLGKLLVSALVDAARSQGCYKVILDCAESKVPFYAKCGLEVRGLQMVHYFDTAGAGVSRCADDGDSTDEQGSKQTNQQCSR